MRHRRKTTQELEAEDRLALSLLLHRENHRCDTPHKGPLALCSCFWDGIFLEEFEEPPESDLDPRWDALFARGFPIMKIIDGSHP